MKWRAHQHWVAREHAMKNVLYPTVLAFLTFSLMTLGGPWKYLLSLTSRDQAGAQVEPEYKADQGSIVRVQTTRLSLEL